MGGVPKIHNKSNSVSYPHGILTSAPGIPPNGESTPEKTGIMSRFNVFFRYLLIVPVLLAPMAHAQDNDEGPDAEVGERDGTLNDWDRLIYVPFKELQKVFDNQEASAVIPYAEYMELLKAYLTRENAAAGSPEAVITESKFDGLVEKDIARLTAELKITVLKEKGWARLPLNFGNTAVGKISTDDEKNTILRGIEKGKYELLLNGPGQHSVTIELLATVKTSPENRSFAIDCPAVGISELTLTIPEPDQSIEIAPLQVLLPAEGSNDKQTVVKASLGATSRFEVRWNPEAGSKPVMDLLASVSNQTSVRIEPGLIQTTAVLDYEILRGELTEVSVLVPKDDRVIDVVSTSGRIRSWKPEAVGETHQRILIELLTPVTDRFRAEIQTERTPEGDTWQLVGKSENGSLQGIHAEGVVRESGRITVSTDSSLATVVRSQSGVKRIDAKSGGKGNTSTNLQAWEFSGTTGALIVQTKPVEPRLLVDQTGHIVFDDDELRLTTKLTYTVERAGVFQLNLSYPEGLTIDTVRADGMSEFNVDKAEGSLTLSLTQKRLGKINVDITAHQSFDATAEGAETEIPSITPLNVERENGRIALFAPQFLDVITNDETLSGLFPAEDASAQNIGRAIRVSSWKYTQRPFTLAVRTTPRPAQMSASVATTASIDPAYVTVKSTLQYNIQNAGIDTFRVAVPETIDHVNFAAAGSHKIQQQEKSPEAEDGWVTWKLVLQDEVTGIVQLTSDWKIPLEELEENSDEQSLTLQPIRILPPFTEDQADQQKRKVSVTQTKGEIRLLRDESLSITAQGEGDTTEKIDVRELQLLPHEGYLAFRYFSQPASATVSIRKHEIHEVVETVVSRAAVEIVTDKQQLANYRCRLKITSSERQRLRIDLPIGADLQAPLLNSQRTTFEAARDVTVQEGWTAYYVNVSREGTSDQEFLLTCQFRCPIAPEDSYPYEGQGSKQILRLPLIGDDTGGTVVQETRVAVWCPKDVSFVGEPDNWTISGRQYWNFWNPMVSPSAPYEAKELNDWVGRSQSAAEFAQQGNVTVYRALGRRSQINIVWWNRPYLVAVISGALLFVGFILRRTSWENRLTLTIVGCLAVALWSLKDSSETMQFLSAGSLGLVAVAGIWLTGLFLGQKQDAEQTKETSDEEPPSPQNQTDPAPPDNSIPPDTPTPPGAVTPSPEVTDAINELMGGK